jgi:hypothetical protein
VSGNDKFPAAEIAAARLTALAWQTSATVQLAMGAIESNYWTAPSGKYNFFGVKARAGQPATERATHEQTADGTTYAIVAGFADYDSVADGFDAYGRLLGLGRPYRGATTAWINARAAAQTPTQLLAAILAYVVRIKAAGYATANNYVSAVSDVITEYDLAQYEPSAAEVAAYQEQMKMGTTAAALTPAATAAAAAAAPISAAAPAISPAAPNQTSLNIGDALEVLIKAAAALAPGAIAAGEALLPQPLAAIVQIFGPSVFEGYIANEASQLEAAVANKTITIPSTGNGMADALVAATANSLNNNESAWVAKFSNLEGTLQSMVASYLAKAAPAPAAAAPAA